MIAEFLPPDLFDWRLAVAFAVTIAAGLMRGFAGFGSVMMLAPVLVVLFGPTQMIVIVMVMEIAISLSLLPGALKHAEWRFVGALSLGAGICLPFGSLILTATDPDILARAIAGIVLAFAILLWTGWRYRGPKRMPITIALGGVSGAMVGATSMGGPPVLAYMLAGQDSATTNRSNIIVYFTVLEVMVLVVLLVRDLIEVDAVIRGAVLTPMFMAVGYLGARGFRQSSEQLYRRIALVMLSLIALFGLLR